MRKYIDVFLRGRECQMVERVLEDEGRVKSADLAVCSRVELLFWKEPLRRVLLVVTSRSCLDERASTLSRSPSKKLLSVFCDLQSCGVWATSRGRITMAPSTRLSRRQLSCSATSNSSVTARQCDVFAWALELILPCKSKSRYDL